MSSLMILGLVEIALACGRPGPPSPPVNETIFAGVENLSGVSPFTFSANLTHLAYVHLLNEFNDETNLIATSYGTNEHLYAQYGVSTINCTDNSNLNAIQSTPAGIKAFGFGHDTQYSGAVFLQFASQCHNDGDIDDFGEGIWWKGTRFYQASDYPTTATDNIVIDFYAVVNCAYGNYQC